MLQSVLLLAITHLDRPISSDGQLNAEVFKFNSYEEVLSSANWIVRQRIKVVRLCDDLSHSDAPELWGDSNDTRCEAGNISRGHGLAIEESQDPPFQRGSKGALL